MRWSGPPVGIARVEAALATAVLARPDAVLAVFDREAAGFRLLNPTWQHALIGWSAHMEEQDDDPARRGWRAWVPSRKPVVARLERWRLTWPAPFAALADAAQRALLGMRSHSTPVFDGAGQRVARLAPDLALADVLPLGAGDVLFSAGSGWSHGDAAALARMKARDGFGYAMLCYDLIPITHPRYWFPEAVRRVRAHWIANVPLADLVVVNARCIAEDLGRFAADNGLATPETARLPLGYDPPPAEVTAPLPEGVAAGRYALFVSTIEPRKGHMTLLRAWRALLARGIPQRHDFRLVFVGRVGWMVEEVLEALAEDDWQGSLLHLQGIGGPTLDALYAGAAFCLYPSTYEGFGLPIIEAFARGKAVLASTGGAVPETVGGLSPCLPPDDPAAWEAALEVWIVDPAARRPWEARIAEGFAYPDWPTAAAAILDAVAGLSPMRPATAAATDGAASGAANPAGAEPPR
ncbi:glycosyltransferase family 4 protein [Humitalea sp. 24SJ18S-53]|uniref:glycosyltransferase family 4 protein n=1 Tax=Humitalea sp. 24SJ18S-53 TaxID=3422307 RepID=UPI003D67C6CB